jgi:hypothetical protein
MRSRPRTARSAARWSSGHQLLAAGISVRCLVDDPDAGGAEAIVARAY